MVHEDIHDAFIAKLKATVEKELVFGDAYNGATQGPIINEGGIVKVLEHIDDALKKGATLVTGGKRLPGFTRYIEPTILTNVPRDALALNDETFGPCKLIMCLRFEKSLIYVRIKQLCWECSNGLEVYLKACLT